jgi:Nickel/cobalt transporter regulator
MVGVKDKMRKLTLALLLAGIAATAPAVAQVSPEGPGEPGRRFERAERIERAERPSGGQREARAERRNGDGQRDAARNEGRRGEGWRARQNEGAVRVAPVQQAQEQGRRFNRDGFGEARRRDQWRDRDGQRSADLRARGIDNDNDGRPDGYYDRNRDGRLDKSWDRNRDGRLDKRWDRNRDGDLDRRWDRNYDDRLDRRYDRNQNGRLDRRWRGHDNWGSYNGWNRDWRNDRRYDWNGYRNQYRNHYRAPRYTHPYGYGYGYRRFGIGIQLDSLFFGSRYWLNDPWRYRLPTPGYGLRWVRYYDDVLLVDTRSGYVVDVIHDFFW